MNKNEKEVNSVPFLIKEVDNKLTTAGKPYQSLKIVDVSKKAMDAVVWNHDFVNLLTANNVVLLSGKLSEYKGVPQLSIDFVMQGDISSIDLFIEVAPVKKEALISEFEVFINQIKNQDIKRIVTAFVNKYQIKIYEYPAGKAIHHDYRYGLLHHTVLMCRLGAFIAKEYPGVNQDLLMAGIIIHDLMKVEELSDATNPEYTKAGKLIGHISLGAMELKTLADELKIEGEVPLLLEHMLLSHHGELDFGSPVLPLTLEALILSQIDLIDSRINIVTKALKDTEPGEFTQKVFALDGRSFYKPKL
ncbi:MAG: HD domain-containing protein [Erysipelotrichaceae bacterium]|jgi:3'-5' exoribonuclease|nr:HD domain-containing protein [Erysipelotrichaceae bacterium]